MGSERIDCKPEVPGRSALKLTSDQQVAAQEFAKHGITVVNYCPGMVNTPMWASVDEYYRKYFGGEPGEHKAKFESNILVGRLSEPEDIAKFVSYLSSKECDYITGQSMLIDGGCFLT